MSQMQGGEKRVPGANDDEQLEEILLHGVRFPQEPETTNTQPATVQSMDEDEEENGEVQMDSDIQGALGLFAEAAQDMTTATVEVSLGRHFACVDYCNQVAEKAAQAVSLLRYGRRSFYDHDLQALGKLVGAPPDIQEEMAILTPFHPEAFYADTPPEEADEMIDAEQANSYLQNARKVLRWARNIVLHAS